MRANPRPQQGVAPIAKIAASSDADGMAPATSKLLTFIAAHACMLVLMGGLVAHYQPDPNGFRLNHLDVLAWFAVLTLPPLVIGMIARSGVAIGLIATAHALSPLSLVNAMREEDLNFALILWWIPLPLFAGIVVIADRIRKGQRRA